MLTNNTSWGPHKGLHTLFHLLTLISVSFNPKWFRDARDLSLNIIVRRLATHEVTVVMSVPYLFKWSVTMTAFGRNYPQPSIRETGFEINNQHVKLSWRRALLGTSKDLGWHWAGMWRDILGVQVGPAYVIRMLDTETHHYYRQVGDDEYRAHRVEVEAILYGQQVRGRWWFPMAMERRWVVVTPSEPILTRLGVVKTRVYPCARGRHIKTPLEVFRNDMLKMSLPE